MSPSRKITRKHITAARKRTGKLTRLGSFIREHAVLIALAFAAIVVGPALALAKCAVKEARPMTPTTRESAAILAAMLAPSAALALVALVATLMEVWRA